MDISRRGFLGVLGGTGVALAVKPKKAYAKFQNIAKYLEEEQKQNIFHQRYVAWAVSQQEKKWTKRQWRNRLLKPALSALENSVKKQNLHNYKYKKMVSVKHAIKCKFFTYHGMKVRFVQFYDHDGEKEICRLDVLLENA